MMCVYFDVCSRIDTSNKLFVALQVHPKQYDCSANLYTHLSFADIIFQQQQGDFYAKTFSKSSGKVRAQIFTFTPLFRLNLSLKKSLPGKLEIVIGRSSEDYFVSKPCDAGLNEPRAFEIPRTEHRKLRLSSLRAAFCAAIFQPRPFEPPHSITPD